MVSTAPPDERSLPPCLPPLLSLRLDSLCETQWKTMENLMENNGEMHPLLSLRLDSLCETKQRGKCGQKEVAGLRRPVVLFRCRMGVRSIAVAGEGCMHIYTYIHACALVLPSIGFEQGDSCD